MFRNHVSVPSSKAGSRLEDSLHHTVYFQPLKMELIHGSETSANYILTPGKYPKEHIQYIIRSFIIFTLHRIRAIRSSRIRQTGMGQEEEETGNANKGRDLGDLGINGRITLRWI
jgi:hypothetical protein